MRDDGAADGRGDGVVDDLHRLHLAVAPEVLANPVKDHHRLVDRVTQHRQHCGQHRQRELPLEEGKKAQDDDDVMQVGDDGRHGVFPLKAKRQVDHDADHHHGQRLEAVLREFFANLRADKLGATQFHLRILRFERCHHALALLRRAHAFLRGQADHHIARGAEGLHLHIGKAQAGDGAAHLADISGLRVAHFHHGAAGELDRQVQPAREQEKHRQHKSGKGDDVENQGMPHERNVLADFEKFHGGLSVVGSGSVGRRQ